MAEHYLYGHRVPTLGERLAAAKINVVDEVHVFTDAEWRRDSAALKRQGGSKIAGRPLTEHRSY